MRSDPVLTIWPNTKNMPLFPPRVHLQTVSFSDFFKVFFFTVNKTHKNRIKTCTNQSIKDWKKHNGIKKRTLSLEPQPWVARAGSDARSALRRCIANGSGSDADLVTAGFNMAAIFYAKCSIWRFYEVFLHLIYMFMFNS